MMPKEMNPSRVPTIDAQSAQFTFGFCTNNLNHLLILEYFFEKPKCLIQSTDFLFGIQDHQLSWFGSE